MLNETQLIWNLFHTRKTREPRLTGFRIRTKIRHIIADSIRVRLRCLYCRESMREQIIRWNLERRTHWKIIEWSRIARLMVSCTFLRAEGRDRSPHDRDSSKSTVARFAEDWEESGMSSKREHPKNENHGSIGLSMEYKPHSKIQRVRSKNKRDNLDVISS